MRKEIILPFLRKNREEQEMRRQLEREVRKGIILYIDNEVMTPAQIANICVVREKGNYMPDYVMDVGGSYVEIRYDRLNHM